MPNTSAIVPEDASWYHLGQVKSVSAALKMDKPDVLLADNLHVSVPYTEVTEKCCAKERNLHLNVAVYHTQSAGVTFHSNKQIVLITVYSTHGDATGKSSSQSVIPIRTC